MRKRYFSGEQDLADCVPEPAGLFLRQNGVDGAVSWHISLKSAWIENITGADKLAGL